ncbi:unnamed protein product [Triticum turgidum subsp. durum]|uniref:DNA2/NAM7 helicase-like C-terminal domain-containing protein n=1 Tax=Triticum turgidum subsp. durum TaxID=4567 RepID=A0A9R1QB34_TRITD|nr:unnamed protein product [Triticum turgidum subsp. durum]
MDRHVGEGGGRRGGVGRRRKSGRGGRNAREAQRRGEGGRSGVDSHVGGPGGGEEGGGDGGGSKGGDLSGGEQRQMNPSSSEDAAGKPQGGGGGVEGSKGGDLPGGEQRQMNPSSSEEAAAKPQGGGGGVEGGKGGDLPGGGEQCQTIPSSSEEAAGKPQGGGRGLDGSQGGSFTGGGQSMNSPASLKETILGWDVDDILADNQTLPEVPDFSDSVEEYMSAYSALLVQECRAAVKDALQNIHESSLPYIVKHILPTNSKSEIFLDVDLNLDAKGSWHVAREGDLFLFSTYSPQQEEFKYSYKHRSFGIASDISPHSKFHRGFKADSTKKLKNFRYATFLINLNGFLSAWKAMQVQENGNNCAGIRSIMKLPKLPSTDDPCCPQSVCLNNTVFGNLSGHQRIIASSVARAFQCKHGNIVKLLWGPPGSGKTLVITKVLRYLQQLSMRIFICVPSEDHVLSLLMLLEESEYKFNDLLVLDNLEGREITQKVRETCLQDRSLDFLCCIKMYGQLVHEMILLLNLEMFCTKKCDHKSVTRCGKTSLPVFKLQAFKNSFSTLVTGMRQCLLELKGRFSGMCLTNENVESIGNLLDTLEVLDNLLNHKIKDEKSVHQAFGLVTLAPSAAGFHEYPFAEELNSARVACLRAVETLKHSITLPKHFRERRDIENYCIQKCQVIVSSTCSNNRLLQLDTHQIDLLIVDGAANIKEYDLIVPLRLPIRHVWMSGTANKQPTTNKVAQDDGFSNNLFQRLSQLGFPMDRLTEQFLINPAVFQFPNEYLYEGKILGAQNDCSPSYSKEFESLILQNYLFMDVVKTGANADNDLTEESAILYILQQVLFKSWKGVNRKLNVAVVCLHSSRADAVKSRLINKHGTQEKINLHVKCASSLQGEMYDVVIMSALSTDNKKFVHDQHIISTITQARYCLWTLVYLLDAPRHDGVFTKLLTDATERGCFVKLSPVVSDQLDKKVSFAHLFGGNPAPRKVTIEFTWNGRPHNSKYILADLRDQKSSDTCTLQSALAAMESTKKFQYSKFKPPKDFEWILSDAHLRLEYKVTTKKDIGEEVDMPQRGCKRLDTGLHILKETGAIAHKPQQPEQVSPRRFKLKSYSRLEINENGGMSVAARAVVDGTFFLMHFKVSRNYFTLKPGQVYHFDANNAYLSPSFLIPASHAVMMIGSGDTHIYTELPSGDIQHEKSVHVNFQNSAGKLLGDDGFGKIGSSSVRGLYQLTI